MDEKKPIRVQVRFFADGSGAEEWFASAEPNSPYSWSVYPFTDDAAYQRFRAKLIPSTPDAAAR